MLHGETGVASLLVLSRRDGRCQGPEDHQDGEGGQESEEDGGVEATVELAGNPPRHCYEKGKEKIVVEGVAARSICRERCIFDGRELDCSQLLVNIRGWERAKRGTHRSGADTIIRDGNLRGGGSRCLDEFKVLGGLGMCFGHDE